MNENEFKKRRNMETGKDKLERLLNPKTVEDYGLSISVDELMSLDEGRIFLSEFLKEYVPSDKWPEVMGFKGEIMFDEETQEAMEGIARTVESEILRVLQDESEK